MKKIISLVLALALIFALAACGSGSTATTAAEESAAEEAAPAEEPAAEAETESAEAEPEAAEPEAEPGEINLYVLSGPTGIGALNLWAAAEEGSTRNTYNVTMTGANDEIVAAISNGEADIAAVATNLAATLYNKTSGGVSVLAVNTLGVLSILSSGEEIASVADLAGRTIYAPGQGANPEYILRYVLAGNGIDPDNDVTINFVAEGSELLSVWASDPDAFIMAPQPVATTILMQNEGSVRLFDMTDEWNAVSGGESTLMMGCVIVRNEFLEANPGAVEIFLQEYAESIAAAQTDTEGTAALCESYGIIPKAAVAMKALPYCGLTFVSGSEMKAQLADTCR